MTNLFDLSGRVAMVSGTASGMGRAIALAYAEAGADLLLVDLNTTGNEATAERIRALGRRAVAQTCDVSEPAQLDALFARLDQEYGRLDVQANVAGEGCIATPEELTMAQLQRVLAGLVVGRFYACQLAGKRMLAAGKGSIINIGSLASVSAMGRGHIAYSMAMGAVAQMTRELSTEWSARGVRVNTILCGQVPGKGHYERAQADPDLWNKWLNGAAIGRLGVPEDIQGVALLLASDASSWITGTLIPMDGGNLAMNASSSHGVKP